MIVISVIITSSPNGSSGVTLMEGGGERLGVCAGASDRAKPITTAAARGSRKIREMTIEISPAGPVPGRRRRSAYGPVDCRNTRSHKRLAIKSLQPYNRKHIGKIEAWARYPIIPL